ncbi:hypothetical protein MK805_07330 [Shimazuella sp. AN120528]|uniref:hypothetical protein n=1 Tax=Shimazuella soli TaxID=1892854 RepID=UPI001F0E4F0A|nr:hypothetical protein [Shimazuella soli]MCH5584783.1 hypothetical protein [Shimazuella soli]
MQDVVFDILALVILWHCASIGHVVGDYLLQTDKMDEHKGALHRETKEKKWTWQEALCLLFDYRKSYGEKRKDYLKSLWYNFLHVFVYALSIYVLFVSTSYMLNYAMIHKRGVEFNPVERIGWSYFLFWLIVNAVLHGFIDRRWPVKAKMIHMGQESYFKDGGGAPYVDQALHKYCLHLTTYALPLAHVLL